MRRTVYDRNDNMKSIRVQSQQTNIIMETVNNDRMIKCFKC